MSATPGTDSIVQKISGFSAENREAQLAAASRMFEQQRNSVVDQLDAERRKVAEALSRIDELIAENSGLKSDRYGLRQGVAKAIQVLESAACAER